MCETQLQEVLPEEPEALDIPTEAETISEESFSAAPPAPRKKHWVPYVILAVIFVIGLAFYLGTQGTSKAQRVSDPLLSWFSIEDGTLYFDSSQYIFGNTLVVPETVAGQTVTALSENCFSGADMFIMIKLPDTLEVIGNSAFSGCTKLRGVFIPESVVRIGSNAFLGCTKLESLCIPYGVASIGKSAFGSCPKLNHIFYGGSMEDWKLLYPEYIARQTCIYAADGILTQADTDS